MAKKLGRLGMVAGVVTFVRSPQGQQLIRKAQEWYADPVHQQQVRRAVTTSVAKARSVGGRRVGSDRPDPVVRDARPTPRSPRTIASAD